MGSVLPSKILANGVLAPKSTAASMANETPLSDVALRALVFMAHTRIVGIVLTVIMGLSFRTTRDLHNAIHIVWLTTPNLDLNRSMRNPEIVCQLFGDLAQHVLTAPHALFFHRDVAATTDHSRADCPDVEIMHCQNAMHITARFLD